MYTLFGVMASFLKGRLLPEKPLPIAALQDEQEQIVSAIRAGKILVRSRAGAAYAPGNSFLFYGAQLPLWKLYGWRTFCLRASMNILQIVPARSYDHRCLHWHTSDVIAYVLEGEGVMTYKDRKGHYRYVRLQAGQLVVIPCGVWHHQNCSEGGHMTIMALELRCDGKPLDYQLNHYK